MDRLGSGSKSIQYSESTRRIASCDNMEDFWQTCVRLPQPSELLSNRMALNVADRFRTIDARMVFGKASHHSGRMRHLQVQFKPSLGGGQLDEYWSNLVLGVIGGTIELADVITSVRLANVYVGSGSNLQTRSGMTWKGVSLVMAIEFVYVVRTLSYGEVLGAQSWKSLLRIERNSAGFGPSQEDRSQRDTSH